MKLRDWKPPLNVAIFSDDEFVDAFVACLQPKNDFTKCTQFANAEFLAMMQVNKYINVVYKFKIYREYQRN
jgi:hypothetical protein